MSREEVYIWVWGRARLLLQEQFRVQFDDLVWTQYRKQVAGGVGTRVWGELRSRIRSQAGEQVQAQAAAQIREACHEKHS